MDLGKESKSALKPKLQLSAQATTGATSLEAVHIPLVPSQQQCWLWATGYPVFPDLQVWLWFFSAWLMVWPSIQLNRRRMPKTPQLLSQTGPDASGALWNEPEVYQDVFWVHRAALAFTCLISKTLGSRHRPLLTYPSSLSSLLIHSTFLSCFRKKKKKYTWVLHRGAAKDRKCDPTQESFLKWNFSGMTFSSLPASLSAKAEL